MRTLGVLLTGLLCASAMPAALRASEGQEEAVRKMFTDYVAAFNNQDVETVSKLWAEGAEHVGRATGEQTTGRDEIATHLAETFEAHPKIRLSGRIDRVRLIKPDVAAIEGQATAYVRGEEPEETVFSGILIREDGRWVIELLEESPVPVPATPYDALQELEFLVGHWVDEAEAARVDTTVRWSTSHTFLVRSYVVHGDDGVEHEGTQVIGWDPRSKHIRSWTFDSNGSFGDGVWSRTDDGWLIKSTQTLADGRAASGTYVLTREGDDALSLQLIGLEIEGEPQPASETVRVVRAADEVEGETAASEPDATTESDATPDANTATEPNATTTRPAVAGQAKGATP